MSVDRSRFIPASAEAADDAINSYMGGPLTIKQGEMRYLRFMPSFKQQDGRGVWFSSANRHYGIPLVRPTAEESRSTTFDCPASIGARCLVCENSKLFQQIGAWDDGSGRGCKPSRRVRFNVIDAERPNLGVLIFEDGMTTWKRLRSMIKKQDPKLMDPFEGSVLVVENTGEEGVWRDIWKAEGNPVSLDELHPDALEWALPENLPDLDASWDFPSYDEQVALFTGVSSGEAVLDVGQAPQSLPPAEEEDEPKTIEVEVVNDDDDDGEDDQEQEVTRPWEANQAQQEPAERPEPTGGQGGSSLLEKFQQEIDTAEEEDSD